MAALMSIIAADLTAALNMIEEYEKSHSGALKNIAAYHLQQAAEKLIKIQILSADSGIDDHKLYTHNLDFLVRTAKACNINLTIPEYVFQKRNIITGWESGSRYIPDFSVRIDTLKKACSVIYEWYNDLKSSGLR